jgi:O-antigen/teichoic acid export membrane protein
MVNTVLGVSELFILIDRPMINLVNTILTIAAVLGLSLYLVPAHGMAGAAVAVFLSYAFMNTLRLAEVHFFYRLQPFTRFHLKALLAAAASFGATYAVKVKVHPAGGVAADLLLVAVFMLLYGLALLLAGVAGEERAFGDKLLRMAGLRKEGAGR